MTRQEWQDSGFAVMMKNKNNGFLLGFFNPSDDLLKLKSIDQINQMIVNLNKEDPFILYELLTKKEDKPTNPGI